MDVVADREREIAELRQRISQGEDDGFTTGSDRASASPHGPTGANSKPAATSSARTEANDESFSPVYETDPLTLAATGCGGPVWIDLDEPRVAVNENADSSTEIFYDTCADPAQFEGFDISLSKVESVDAQACVEGLRSEPKGEISTCPYQTCRLLFAGE